MIAQPAAPEARHYTAQYELLRAQVLGDGCAAVPSRGAGLAILLHEGLPGWLAAIAAVMPPSLAPPAGDPPAAAGDGRSAPGWLSGAQRAEVTILLASLVLSTRRIACSSPTEG